jgi:hypothetical protein
MDRSAVRIVVASQIVMAVAIIGIVVLVWAKTAGPLPHGPSGWWSARTSIRIGAIGGSVVGYLGALIGVLGGCGIARRFVLTLTAVVAVAGLVSLVTGLIAVILGQPYMIYYPLLILGIVMSASMGPIFFGLRWAYAQRELRKMAAMDSQ